MTQEVGVMDITQADFDNRKDPDEDMHMIFEPELPKIVQFFNDQIRLILFNRILLEADLARTAARMLAMSAAEEHTNDMIKIQKRSLNKTIGSIKNRQLLETFSGSAKWKKH
jgi:F0F1-type ATP synthase gamma subunit